MQAIIIIVVLLIILFKLFAPPKPSGVVLYFANIGCGKTTFLAKIAIQEIKKMKKGKSKYKNIISNAVIAGVKYVPDIREIIKSSAMQSTLILIDEGSIVYNNRKQVLTEKEIQYFKLIRHYQSTLIVLSQSYDDIDVTLRRLYTQIYLMRRLPWVTLIQPIKKRVGIDETTKQIIDEYRFAIPFSWRLFLRPRYFKFFNSWWIPQDIPITNLDLIDNLSEYQKRKRLHRIFGTVNEEEINQIIKLKEEVK